MKLTTIAIVTTLFIVTQIKAQSIIHLVNGKKIIKILNKKRFTGLLCKLNTFLNHIQQIS